MTAAGGDTRMQPAGARIRRRARLCNARDVKQPPVFGI